MSALNVDTNTYKIGECPARNQTYHRCGEIGHFQIKYFSEIANKQENTQHRRKTDSEKKPEDRRQINIADKSSEMLKI